MIRFGSTPRTMRDACSLGVRSEQRVARLFEIADRRRESPRARAWRERAQARERELHLHAALRSEQLVPLVDDDGAQIGEDLAHVVAREKQRETLGGRDERGRQALSLSRAHRSRRVARARLERPRNLEIAQRSGERFERVRGERAQRRDPEHAQRRRRTSSHLVRAAARIDLVGLIEPFEQRSPPRGERLARTGGGVNRDRSRQRDTRSIPRAESRTAPSARGEPPLCRSNALTLRIRRHARDAFRECRHACCFRSVCNASSESASDTGLSLRQRTMRGKRTAMPDLCLGDA